MNLKTRISRLEVAAHPGRVTPKGKFPEECICYPKLQYGLSLKGDEIRAAEVLPCPLHGNRIPDPSTVLYLARWVGDKDTLADWETTDPEEKRQYEKAVRATRAFLEAHK